MFKTINEAYEVLGDSEKVNNLTKLEEIVRLEQSVHQQFWTDRLQNNIQYQFSLRLYSENSGFRERITGKPVLSPETIKRLLR